MYISGLEDNFGESVLALFVKAVPLLCCFCCAMDCRLASSFPLSTSYLTTGVLGLEMCSTTDWLVPTLKTALRCTSRVPALKANPILNATVPYS